MHLNDWLFYSPTLRMTFISNIRASEDEVCYPEGDFYHCSVSVSSYCMAWLHLIRTALLPLKGSHAEPKDSWQSDTPLWQHHLLVWAEQRFRQTADKNRLSLSTLRCSTHKCKRGCVLTLSEMLMKSKHITGISRNFPVQIQCVNVRSWGSVSVTVITLWHV